MTRGRIRWVEQRGAGDIAPVGGKNASLGELFREFTPRGVLVPNGFAVTVDAYRSLLDTAGAWDALHDALGGIDPADQSRPARRTPTPPPTRR